MIPRTSGWRPRVLVVLACGAAILVGASAGKGVAPLVALVTLLPLVSHVRWVGFRRAVTEPSAATIILVFYIFVFPLRGLVIAANDFTDVQAAPESVTSSELILMLVLASVATTVLVEAFHFMRRRPSRGGTHIFAHDGGRVPTGIGTLAALLGVLALTAAVVQITRGQSLTGAAPDLLSHSKAASLTGSRSFIDSIWALFAVPAVWCVACAALAPGVGKSRQLVFAALGATLVLIQILAYGSRLSALLSLVGVWVIIYYSGRRIPVAAVLASIPVVILLSIPIVAQRPGGDLSGLPVVERYSQVASYGILDQALAVRQRPTDIKAKLTEAKRWMESPSYLAPSWAWPGKPNIEFRRMDLYVAQSLGNQNQQDTGYPTSYMTELWLYGGWPAVLLASALVGALLGGLHRKLVGSPAGDLSPASLIWYCFVVIAGFSYYKDGDIVISAVGDIRTGAYLAFLLLATGVWGAFGLRRPRPTTAPPGAPIALKRG